MEKESILDCIKNKINGPKIILVIDTILSFILLIIYCYHLDSNLNFFSFVIGELFVIFIFFLFLHILNISLDIDMRLILTLTIASIAVVVLSFMFFRKIEVKPGFFHYIVTFEISTIAFLTPLIFSIVSWISKKYNFRGIIYIFGYNIALPIFFLSFLNLTFIIILQLIPNLPKLQFYIFFHLIAGFIFSSFLITVFFELYMGGWIINFIANSEKVIDLAYQYAKRCFKSLNKKSSELSDLLQQLRKIEENKINLADKDKIEKKIDKLGPKIFEKQRGFNETIKNIGTTLLDEIKEGENEELIIRKLEKIEDLVNKVFEVRRDYSYWSKEALINQIINIYKATVEPQNIHIYQFLSKNVYSSIKDIYVQLKEKPLGNDILLINMIEKEVLCQKETLKKQLNPFWLYL